MKMDIFFAKTSKKAKKLKTLLNLTVTRLAVLRNRHHARCSQARGDVAQLLQVAQLDRALLRAEQVIKEQNMMDVFAMVEGYCHLITERAALLEHHKECPDELREAVASLAFAASRSGELPELQDARSIFASMFGKEFTAAAVELRNNCGVNLEMIKKLSTRQPSLESRRRVVKEIATEIGIALDFDPPASAEVRQIQEQSTRHEENPPSASVQEPPRLDRSENLSMRTRQQYKDVASAAQAAFESAAYAAAAARVAVELSRSESQGRGAGDPSQRRKQRAEEQRSGDKEKHPVVESYSPEPESEEEDSSASSPDSVEVPLPRAKADANDTASRMPLRNPGGGSGQQHPIKGSKPVSVRTRRGL